MTPAGEHGTPDASASSSRSLSFTEMRALKHELMRELETSWQAKCPTPVEDLLARWPQDPKIDADVASLLFEDFRFRNEQDPSVSLDEHAARFPEHAQALKTIVLQNSVHRSLGGERKRKPSLRLPTVGDRVFGFTLRRELGKGAFACVHLAEQGDLAGRPVAVKISAIEGDEPQTLAQLQHTHIVPIYSVHDDPRSGIRVVCMPFFGGASLNQVLAKTWREHAPPQRGEQLVDALANVSAPPPEPTTTTTPSSAQDSGAQSPTTILNELSYVQASAWIVARLAEGLQHAHQRGVLHRDIKPSNVLICADGQPMLLDFNLSLQMDHDPAEAALGGTLAYMAPEHLQAVLTREAVKRRQVDGRADVYSLGMVLFEMLTGARPFDQSASHTPLPMLVEAMAVERAKHPPSLRRKRPDVPWSMESIVQKCLSPDLNERYQQPEQLAEDLRRFLEDRPLRHAPELSWRERVHKWTRRNPRTCAIGGVGLVATLLLTLLGYLLVGSRASLTRTQDRLHHSQAQDRKDAYRQGTVRATLLVSTQDDTLREHLHQGRQTCEETLALYGVLKGAPLDQHPDWNRLSPPQQRRLAEDTEELLLLLAGADVRLADADSQSCRKALRLLDLAKNLPLIQTSRAALEDRATYLDRLGDRENARRCRELAKAIPARTARDFYLLATAHSRSGDLKQAVTCLSDAVRLDPKHYWSWLQRGICRLQMEEPALALADFGVCVGLWPEHAWGYFNCGVAMDQLGRRAEAVANYTAALKRDPAFVLAYLNRGLARLELHHRQALDDFKEALRRGRDEAAVHLGRGVALERLGKHKEADRAFESAWQRAAGLAAEQQVRLRWVYGFAVAFRLPEKAAAAFRDVLKHNPQHPQALYGIAMLHDRQGKPNEALEHYDKAIKAAPRFVEPRRFRALLRARLGDGRAAVEDVNQCLQQAPKDGANLYAAACVTAILSDQQDEPAQQAALRAQALSFLQKAFARGYGRDRAQEDEDLVVLRDRPEFRRLFPEKPQRSQRD